MSKLEAALSYHRRGWQVIPCQGKKPIISEWQKCSLDEQQITSWWTKYPDANIGLLLGERVVRVDADGAEAIKQFFTMLHEQPSTMEYATPSGGRGWLFEVDQPTHTAVLWKGTGEHEELRLQGRRQDGADQCILPPSTGYHWISDKSIIKLPRVVADVLLSLRAAVELNKIIPSTIVVDETQLDAALACVPSDDRDIWLRIGMALHSANDLHFARWVEWSKNSHKFREGECEGIWQNFKRSGRVSLGTLFHIAKQYGYRPKREPLTDVGNANILAKEICDKLKYSDAKGWFAWDGVRWTVDKEGLYVREAAKASVLARYEKTILSLLTLKELGDDTDAKRAKLKNIGKVASWCIASQSGKHIRDIVYLTQSKPNIRVNYEVFDAQPMLLNCKNGTLDLVTRGMKDHDPMDMLTQLCPTEYWPEALCPRWDAFLREVFVEDELIRWVQKLLGYCITGAVSEHVLPVWHGSGRNGKSTLVKAIVSVLGQDYAGTAPSGFVVLHRNEQHPAKLTTLYGKRFIADLETGDSAKLNEDLVKRLTGGDEIVARGMYQDFWKFKPSHKLILATNFVPTVRGMDLAMQSRIKLVPFSQSFLGREEKNLDDRLAAEAPGILRWLVEGCRMWQEEGLGSTKAVEMATDSYWHEQDTVRAFFEESVVRVPDAKIAKKMVAEAYRMYCINNGLSPVSSISFGKAVSNLGVERDANYYFGVKLK